MYMSLLLLLILSCGSGSPSGGEIAPDPVNPRGSSGTSQPKAGTPAAGTSAALQASSINVANNKEIVHSNITNRTLEKLKQLLFATSLTEEDKTWLKTNSDDKLTAWKELVKSDFDFVAAALRSKSRPSNLLVQTLSYAYGTESNLVREVTKREVTIEETDNPTLKIKTLLSGFTVQNSDYAWLMTPGKGKIKAWVSALKEIDLSTHKKINVPWDGNVSLADAFVSLILAYDDIEPMDLESEIDYFNTNLTSSLVSALTKANKNRVHTQGEKVMFEIADQQQIPYRPWTQDEIAAKISDLQIDGYNIATAINLALVAEDKAIKVWEQIANTNLVIFVGSTINAQTKSGNIEQGTLIKFFLDQWENLEQHYTALDVFTTILKHYSITEQIWKAEILPQIASKITKTVNIDFASKILLVLSHSTQKHLFEQYNVTVNDQRTKISYPMLVGYTMDHNLIQSLISQASEQNQIQIQQDILDGIMLHHRLNWTNIPNLQVLTTWLECLKKLDDHSMFFRTLNENWVATQDTNSILYYTPNTGKKLYAEDGYKERSGKLLLIGVLFDTAIYAHMNDMDDLSLNMLDHGIRLSTYHQYQLLIQPYLTSFGKAFISSEGIYETINPSEKVIAAFEFVYTKLRLTYYWDPIIQGVSLQKGILEASKKTYIEPVKQMLKEILQIK